MKQVLRSSVLEMKKVVSDIEENEALEKDFERSRGFWCSRCSFSRVCFGEWSEI